MWKINPSGWISWVRNRGNKGICDWAFSGDIAWYIPHKAELQGSYYDFRISVGFAACWDYISHSKSLPGGQSPRVINLGLICQFGSALERSFSIAYGSLFIWPGVIGWIILSCVCCEFHGGLLERYPNTMSFLWTKVFRKLCFLLERVQSRWLANVVIQIISFRKSLPTGSGEIILALDWKTAKDPKSKSHRQASAIIKGKRSKILPHHMECKSLWPKSLVDQN